MDIANLLKMGAEMFINSDQSGDAGSGLNTGKLISALSDLASKSLGGEGFDLGSLLSKMDAGGLGEIAQSWLGDGENAAIAPEQINNMLGADKISDFASKLGLSYEEALGGLSDALPRMVDKASSDGALLESFGGVAGAMGLARKLFDR